MDIDTFKNYFSPVDGNRHSTKINIPIFRFSLCFFNALQNAFIEWMKSCHKLTDGEVIAIDEKTLKESYNRTTEQQNNRTTDQAAIHIVNALATANGVCLGQSKVDSKKNEITAISKLLELLDLNMSSYSIT